MNNKILQNASWIIGLKIIQSCLGLVISMLTARFLGPSNYGLINYAASIVAFCTPIVQLGFTGIMVREIVSDPGREGEILGTSIFSFLFTGFIGVIGMSAFALIVNKGEKDTIIVCFLYSMILLADAAGPLSYWFQAHLLSKYTSIVSLVVYLIVAAYKIYLLLTHKSVYWFAISNALDYLLISVFQLVLYKKLGGMRFSFSLTRFRDLFSKGKYYIISGIMIAVFSQTDRIMLKLMLNDTATGLYSSAVACAGLTSFVFGALIDSMAPEIFKSKKVDNALFEKRVKQLYSVVIYLALAQSVGMTIFSKLIIKVLYGQAYLAAVPALRVIVWYTTFSYIGAVRNRWLLAEEKQNLIPRIDLAGAISNVFMNLLLIPRYGIVGAATASLVTQMFTNVGMGWIIKAIRPNNALMVQSLNVNYILDLIKCVFERG